MNFILALKAFPEVMKALKSILSMLRDVFGPDWIKKVNDLQAANTKLANATTPGEKDAALQEIASVFYRAP